MPNRSPSKFSKFYFPGMISLVLLPLLCVIYLFEDRILPKYGRMELIAFNKEDFSKFKKGVIRPDDMDNVNTYRKYQDVSFTGNSGHNAEEQVRLKTLLVKLNTKTDLVNGIHITLGKHSRYKDMVAAIDNFHQNDEKLQGFIMIDNEIFIYQPTPLKESGIVLHSFGDDMVWRYHKASPVVTLKDVLGNTYANLLRFWPSIIALIAMLYFALSKKRYYFLSKPTISTNHRPLIQP